MRLRTLLVTLDLGWLQRSPVLAKLLQVETTKVLVRPIVVCFDLTTFLFGSKHYNDADILLPDDAPEVLKTG